MRKRTALKKKERMLVTTKRETAMVAVGTKLLLLEI